MAPFVDQAPVPHLADFIDAVGELVAAILDVDGSVAGRKIAAIGVSGARHRRSVDSERLELAMQRRALHADEFGGARDIAAEAVDLGEQVFALEYFARFAQRQA